MKYPGDRLIQLFLVFLRKSPATLNQFIDLLDTIVWVQNTFLLDFIVWNPGNCLLLAIYLLPFEIENCPFAPSRPIEKSCDIRNI